MAKMTVKLGDALVHGFETAGREMDAIAQAALRAGAAEVYGEAQSRLAEALSRSRKGPKRGSGELRSALGISPMSITKQGAYDIRVGFREPRRKQPGKRVGRSRKGGGYYVATNAMVANILEHGHKGRLGGQEAAPWWEPGLKSSRKKAQEAIQKTVEDRLSEIFKEE